MSCNLLFIANLIIKLKVELIEVERNLYPCGGTLNLTAMSRYKGYCPCRYIRKGMLVEVGKSDTSAPFDQVLELLSAKDEYLAFAPDTSETKMMINLLSMKFPLLKVCF